MDAATVKQDEVRPFCPRCAYDLSGIPASWADSCPLNGICAECGFEFAWCDVIHPLRAVPAWSFEHAPVRRGNAFRVTLGRSLTPWRFWRELRLQFPVRAARLAIVALVLLLTTNFVIGAFTIRVAPNWPELGVISDKLDGQIPNWVQALVCIVLPYQSIGYLAAQSPGDSPWALVSIGCFVFTPVGFLALPITLRTCRVRKIHLVRIGAYSLTAMPLLFAAFFLLSRGSPLRTPPTMWRWHPEPPSVAFELFGGLPLLSIAWLLIFWWYAGTRYLKLPHAAGVTCAMAAIGFLISLVLVGLLHPYFTNDPVMYWLFQP